MEKEKEVSLESFPQRISNDLTFLKDNFLKRERRKRDIPTPFTGQTLREYINGSLLESLSSKNQILTRSQSRSRYRYIERLECLFLWREKVAGLGVRSVPYSCDTCIFICSYVHT